jgi:MFS family permease
VADRSSVASAAAGQDASTAYAWYVIGVLFLAQTFSFLDRMIMGLLVGPIRQSFEISDTQYSLLAGLAFALFYATMGLPLARIADAGNRRNLIVAGISVWSLMTALCGLARGFWPLFSARVGVGVGEAALAPAAYSMITDYFPRHMLARALSVFMLGVTFGSGIAYILGGAVVGYVAQFEAIVVPILGEIEGWQLTFFIVGLPGLLVALLMILTVREPPRSGITPMSQSSVPLPEAARFIWQRRAAYGAHVVGISLFVMVVYALNLWGPTYFIRVFGYTTPQAGWTFGLIMLIAGSGGLLFAGIAADAWVKRGVQDAYIRTIIISMLGMLPFTIALAFVETPTLGIIAIGFAVFFSAFQGGLASGALQLMTPNRLRGQVVALYLLVGNLVGLGLGPTVVAGATDFIFADDAAIGKSIALCGSILCPLAAYILWRALPAIRRELDSQLAATACVPSRATAPRVQGAGTA